MVPKVGGSSPPHLSSIHYLSQSFDTFTRTRVRVSKMNAVARAQLTFQMIFFWQLYGFFCLHMGFLNKWIHEYWYITYQQNTQCRWSVQCLWLWLYILAVDNMFPWIIMHLEYSNGEAAFLSNDIFQYRHLRIASWKLSVLELWDYKHR